MFEIKVFNFLGMLSDQWTEIRRDWEDQTLLYYAVGANLVEHRTRYKFGVVVDEYRRLNLLEKIVRECEQDDDDG